MVAVISAFSHIAVPRMLSTTTSSNWEELRSLVRVSWNSENRGSVSSSPWDTVVPLWPFSDAHLLVTSCSLLTVTSREHLPHRCSIFGVESGIPDVVKGRYSQVHQGADIVRLPPVSATKALYSWADPLDSGTGSCVDSSEFDEE